MVALKSEHPLDGVLPIEIGAVRLDVVADPGVLTLIRPAKEREDGLSSALTTHHGLSWPETGRTVFSEGSELVWFGREVALMMGQAPHKALAQHAALVDQSDGWVCVTFDGQATDDVLARLVPIDLRKNAFGVGQTARSLAFHIPVSITRISETGFRILVMRSMARALVHDLSNAMEAARARR